MARKAAASVRRARATAGAGEELAQVTAKKAVPDPDKDPLALPSFMAETNGGGSPEDVPGFDIFRAVTAGFTTRRIAGPTILAARPDGAFFSQGSLAPSSQGQVIAAFGGGSPASKPEIVIGADSRVLVPNTSTTPWRCICHLEVEYESGPVGFGTGFFAGPKAVITAAHVLIDRSGPDWSRLRKAINVRVIPGRNGTMAPYGYFVSDFERCQLSDLWRDPRSRQEDALAADYAMIPTTDDFWTKDQPTAERLGYFGLKAFTDAEATEKAGCCSSTTPATPMKQASPTEHSGTTPAVSGKWEKPSSSTWSTPRADKAAADLLLRRPVAAALRDCDSYHGRFHEPRPAHHACHLPYHKDVGRTVNGWRDTRCASATAKPACPPGRRCLASCSSDGARSA